MSDMTHTKWFYARWEDSEIWSGGYDSREDCIAAGRADFDDDDQFCICQASNSPLRLADWIGADRMIERAVDELADSDRTVSEADEAGDFFPVTPGQEADLAKRIKDACNKWQDDHGLVFTVKTFEDMFNFETIAALEGNTP